MGYSFVGRILRGIASLWKGLSSKLKTLIPIAIAVVQAIKSFEESNKMDFVEFVVTTAIPGDADDKLVKKGREVVRQWLPKILLELKLVDSINNIEGIDAQLKAILAQLRLSSDETQNIINHGLATLIVEKLSDGQLSWSDSIVISEYYYKNFVKK